MKKLLILVFMCMFSVVIFAKEFNIHSREDGSGTRTTFMDILKIKRMNIEAVITNSGNNMLVSIAGDKKGLGYVSYGSVNSDVKVLKVNNKSITDSDYPVSRKLILVTSKSKESSDLTKDFLKFIYSENGVKIIKKMKFETIKNEGKYSSKNLSGKIEINGSTTVYPLMEKLKEEYIKLNPNVKINLQSVDSSQGIKMTSEGIIDIGMSSRELKAGEDLNTYYIALDKIAIIVNKASNRENITIEELVNLYKY